MIKISRLPKWIAAFLISVLILKVIMLSSIAYMYRKPVPLPAQGKTTQIELSEKTGEVAAITQSFEEEMKERVRHVEATCREMNLTNEFEPGYNDITPQELHRIVVNDKYKVLYCEVAKVASTTLKRKFLMMTGKMANGTNPDTFTDVHRVYGKLYLDYLYEYPIDQIKYRLQNYKKVVLVREPLERILSAFRDKFLGSGKMRKHFQMKYGRKIIKQYRKNPSNHSLETGQWVEFPEFVQYLVDSKERIVQFNEHWKPIIHLCHPCKVHYDFIGEFSTLQRDVDALLKGLKVDNDIERLPQRNFTYAKLKTQDVFEQLYESVDRGLVQDLVQMFRDDARLFSYNSGKIAENIGHY